MLVLQRVDEWMSLEKSSEFISLLSYLDDLHVSLPILAIATCKKDLPEIVSKHCKSIQDNFTLLL